MTVERSGDQAIEGLAEAVRSLMAQTLALRTFAIYSAAQTFSALVESRALTPLQALAVRQAMADAFRGVRAITPSADSVAARSVELVAGVTCH